MAVLIYFLFLSTFIVTSLGDLCYDASGEEVENGRLDCNISIGHHFDRYKSYKYSCKVQCIPGFQSSRYDVQCQSRRFRPRRGETVELKKEFTGYWNFDRSQINCSLPTYCPSMEGVNPKNGKSRCVNRNDIKTCDMSCDFPYVPSEPEFTKEYCSNETQFFWTHVLRNNETKFPSCIVKESCDEIETTVVPKNGQFQCNNQGEVYKSCELECDFGYVATNKNTAAFCGPPSGFRWSNEWTAIDAEIEELAQCEKAPITVVIELWSECAKSNKIFDLAGPVLDMPHSDINIKHLFPMWKLSSFQVECDKNVDEAQPVKLYFNFKDLCTYGTCKMACYYLNMSSAINLANCIKVCELPVANSCEMLNNQRNFILSYIEKEVEKRRNKIESVLSPYEYRSMDVVVDKSNYYGDVTAPTSPFCGPWNYKHN